MPESLAALKHGAAATLPVIFFCTNEKWWAEDKDFREWGAGIAQGYHMKGKTKKLGLAISQVGCLAFVGQPILLQLRREVVAIGDDAVHCVLASIAHVLVSEGAGKRSVNSSRLIRQVPEGCQPWRRTY